MKGAVFVLPMLEASIQTDWSTCSSVRGMQKYSPGGSSIWALSLDRRSLPNKGMGSQGLVETSGRSGVSPKSMPKAGENTVLEAGLICPEC
jgi:hypothetical protein